MNTFIIDFILEFSYLALFLFIAIENLFPPIPSEIILGSAGFLCAMQHMNFILALIIAVSASVIGAYLLYKLGAYFDKDSLLSFFNHQGKWMHIPTQHVEKAFDAFAKHGRISVFFLRFVPIVRSLISIPAGMNHMPLSTFLLLSGTASCIWNCIIMTIGYIAQENYEVIIHQFSTYFKEGIIVLFLIMIIFFSFKTIKKYYMHKN